MEQENEDVKQNKKMFRFDPTIHAGHIMTAGTILFCSIGAWFNLQYNISAVKEKTENNANRIEIVQNDAIKREKEIQENFANSMLYQHNEVVKMRDDMNAWFIRLDDKLDRKADKKGN